MRRIIKSRVTESYVVEGAALRCSFGSSVSRLGIPIGHGVYIHGKKQANISDKQGMQNIRSFGQCLCPNQPPTCTPAVTAPWTNGKSSVIIENHPALLNTSITFCVRGGVITIAKDGQL